MKSETEILKKMTQAFKNETGLSMRYKNLDVRGSRTDHYIDAKLEIELESETVKYSAAIKANLNDSVIGRVALQAKSLGEKFALVTKHVTQSQSAKLRHLGLTHFDTVGNAYINEPGAYIFVSGRKLTIEGEQPAPIFSSGGIRVVMALLNKPGLENYDYRTIADETDVPRTSIGRLMAGLESSGYLMRRGDRRRHLIHKAELIKRWVEAYGETFRAKQDPKRYRSTKFGGRWWNDVNLAEYKAFWGGETGGAKLTKYLTPKAATIYADSNLPKLQAKYGLVRDEKGEIEILRRFWTFGEIGDTAPPLVVYADLLATADERNLETAQMIYDKYLAPLTEETSQ